MFSPCLGVDCAGGSAVFPFLGWRSRYVMDLSSLRTLSFNAVKYTLIVLGVLAVLFMGWLTANPVETE